MNLVVVSLKYIDLLLVVFETRYGLCDMVSHSVFDGHSDPRPCYRGNGPTVHITLLNRPNTTKLG